jgi:hypothetical protein
MNTIKIECPHCRQMMMADSSVTKTGVQCPTCQTCFIPSQKKSFPKWLLPSAMIVLVTLVIVWLQLGFLLIWPILGGLVGAAIGQPKGQCSSGIVWGGFLGPLGWLIVYFLPNLCPKCPECLAPIDPAARKCRHCGSALSIGPVGN